MACQDSQIKQFLGQQFVISAIIMFPFNQTLGIYIQGVPGGICQTSGECSLC